MSFATLWTSRVPQISQFSRFYASATAVSSIPLSEEKKKELRAQLRRLPNPTPPPKGPLSPYMTFYVSQVEYAKESPAYKAADKKSKIKVLASTIAELWKNIKADEKAKYEARAFAAKEEYKKQMTKFSSNLSPKDRLVLSTRLRLKQRLGMKNLQYSYSLLDPDAPVRPVLAFGNFFKSVNSGNEKRVQVPSNYSTLSVVERFKTMGELWKSENNKSVVEEYKKKYEDDFKVYLTKKEAYEKSVGLESIKQGIKIIMKPPKVVKKSRRAVKKVVKKAKKTVAKKKVAVKKVVKKVAKKSVTKKPVASKKVTASKKASPKKVSTVKKSSSATKKKTIKA